MKCIYLIHPNACTNTKVYLNAECSKTYFWMINMIKTFKGKHSFIMLMSDGIIIMDAKLNSDADTQGTHPNISSHN